MKLTDVIVILTIFCMGVWYVDHRARKEERQEYAQAAEAAKEVEKVLKLSSARALQEKDEQIKAVDSKLASIRSELRKRPSRATAPKNSSSCTGRELPREDAGFLAGEAARADRVLKERNYYYEEYERARLELERIQNGKD